MGDRGFAGGRVANIVRLTMGIVLAALSGVASAELACMQGIVAIAYGNSAAEVCGSVGGVHDGGSWCNKVVDGVNTGWCSLASVPGCAEGSTRDVNGVCQSMNCETGQSPLNGKCVSNTCPDGSARALDGLCRGGACNRPDSNMNPPLGTIEIQTVCTDQGCNSSFYKGDGWSEHRATAGECNPGTPPAEPCPPGTVTQTIGATTKCYPTQGSCASKGQCSGTVNGVTVCVACPSGTKTSTTGTKTDTKTTTTPATGGSGGTTGTTTTTTTNGTTTTTQTTGADGSATVEKETKTIDENGVEKTEKEETDKQTFCQENPNSPLCKSGSFSGACGSAPVCDGDAVQCAQARAAFDLNCAMTTEPEGAAYGLGKSISGGGADPLGNPLSAANTTSFNIGEMVSTAGGQRWLSASCPSNVNVLGATMDLSLFCQFAQIVGYLMVAASSVIAVRMVASGNT